MQLIIREFISSPGQTTTAGRRRGAGRSGRRFRRTAACRLYTRWKRGFRLAETFGEHAAGLPFITRTSLSRSSIRLALVTKNEVKKIARNHYFLTDNHTVHTGKKLFTLIAPPPKPLAQPVIIVCDSMFPSDVAMMLLLLHLARVRFFGYSPILLS